MSAVNVVKPGQTADDLSSPVRRAGQTEAVDDGERFFGCVGACFNRELISLPPWFPAHQAAAVLRKKGKAFALITDRTGVNGIASVGALSVAPRTKSVLWCAMSLAQSVTPEMPLDDALGLMDRCAVDFLPVVLGGSIGGMRGGLIAGIVTRQGILACAAAPSVRPSQRLAA